MNWRHHARSCCPVLCVVVLAACGSSAPVVRGGSGSITPPPATATASTPVSASASTSPSVHPVVTVLPSSGLHDSQSVQVNAHGFSPGTALTVVECGNKGTKTGPGDCNLEAMTPTTSDADGRVSVRLVVRRGPFGANKIVCNAGQPCVISVTEATLTPSQEADAPIRFASP